MIEVSDIKKILEISVYAPSGDNSQPWRFEFEKDILRIYSIPQKDNPKFNFRQRGTLFAHGALVENIIISAKHMGYDVGVIEMPDESNSTLTASIKFTKGIPNPQDLFDSIVKRQTNRKEYSAIPLEVADKELLLNINDDYENLTLKFIEDRSKIKTIGRAVAANEIIMLEDKPLHDLFYGDIRWTTSAERRLKWGLYLKTMELPIHKLVFFKILQWWPAANFLNSLGMARFIAKDNAKQYSSVSAFGLILSPDADHYFFKAGRMMQRVWLTAQRNGLSIHPVSGVIYLAQRVLAGEAKEFSPEHIQIISESYNEILGASDCNGPIAMLFRIGYSDPPRGQSSRIDPEIKFL